MVLIPMLAIVSEIHKNNVILGASFLCLSFFVLFYWGSKQNLPHRVIEKRLNKLVQAKTLRRAPGT